MRLLLLTCLLAAADRAAAMICTEPINCKLGLENLDELLLTGGDVFTKCKLEDGSEGVLCMTPADIGDIANRFGPASAPASGGDAIFFPGTNGGTNKNVLDVQPLTSRLKTQQKLVIAAAREEANLVVSEAERTLQSVQQEVAALTETQPNTPEQLQLLFSRPQSDEVKITARSSIKNVQVLKDLKEKAKVGSKAFEFEQPLFNLDAGLQNRANFQTFPTGDDRIPGCTIDPPPVCQRGEKFRRFNGECNSDAEPRLGSAQTAFSRFFPAEYEDGIWQPRSKGLEGEPLPSARLVSQRVVQTTQNLDMWRSLSLMQMGQFLNHDMISTAAFTLDNGGGLFCCNRDNTMPNAPLHPLGCNPISVPVDDPFYSRFGRTCMNQVRSLPAPFENCVAGPTGQLNQVSHFLDLSTVYGSSQTSNSRLRLGQGGLFKMSQKNLLPQEGGRFISGEGRLGENPGLTFMHTIWTREHNRVASFLGQLHRNWSDEQLFQEARRIVVGEYQNIIYNEYLPTVLGFTYTREHGLTTGSGHSFDYTDIIDPRVTAEFSTAAFRFGHAQIPDSFQLMSANGRVMSVIAMEQSFFREDMLQLDNFMSQLATSLTRQKARSVDNTFSPSVHELLFASGGPSGLDLIALNINRGRDHGLPTYLSVLENCIERTIVGSWDALSEFFDPDVLQRLRGVYKNIEDIDLYIGGISEKKVPRAIVGPVFQCIIGEQFFATRYGDKYFYDNGGLPHSLSSDQVRQLQKSSWARILCDNVEGIKNMQPLTFFQPSVFFNGLRSCRRFAIPTVDLRWF